MIWIWWYWGKQRSVIKQQPFCLKYSLCVSLTHPNREWLTCEIKAKLLWEQKNQYKSQLKLKLLGLHSKVNIVTLYFTRVNQKTGGKNLTKYCKRKFIGQNFYFSFFVTPIKHLKTPHILGYLYTVTSASKSNNQFEVQNFGFISRGLKTILH